MFQLSLPYMQDSSRYFSIMRQEPLPVFLDSCWPHSKQGRYDILSANPLCWLSERSGELSCGGRTELFGYGAEDLFATLERIWRDHQVDLCEEIPFIGGWIGFTGYDSARTLELPFSKQPHAIPFSDAVWGFYDWALIVDHVKQEANLVGVSVVPGVSQRLEKWRERLLDVASVATEHIEFNLTEPLQWVLDQDAYSERFSRIQQYIDAGDCYQVNFAQYISAPYRGDPWGFYERLRVLNPAPYSAFMQFGDMCLLSSSPEQFIAVEQQQIRTRPIKGTASVLEDRAADSVQQRHLQQSEKNRAENLMIVDLLRNDLGRVCALGSITVEELFKLETFAGVHHLVSTISGLMMEQYSPFAALKACMPGGSITGAPKVRAMEIIEELEIARRGPYCGSLAFVSLHGTMDSNILIRTALADGSSMVYWAGGGIVADSNMSEEYAEMQLKAAQFCRIAEDFYSASKAAKA